jgi:hypothetical protein
MSTLRIGPGDNLAVLVFDGVELAARPDLREHGQPWFWWSFAIDDPAQELRVRFAPVEGGPPILVGPLGPAVSLDDGGTWSWLGAQADRLGFVWRRPADCRRVRFAMAPPYRLDAWERFAAARPWLRSGVLCRTRRGRSVPFAVCGDDAAPIVVAISARNHACESSASWVLEGFLDAWHGDQALRARVQIVLVPMIDFDGVQDGDAGKGRTPHDHNRDYTATPFHPEVAAWMELLPRLARGRLRLGLDLHAPWICGAWNEHVYGIGSADPAVAAAQERLLDLWSGVHAGELPIGPNRLLRAGQAWNAGTAPTCGRWYASIAGCGMSIEFPYHGVRRDGLSDLDDAQALVPCTPERLRGLGASLAQAMARWLSA